LTLIEPMAPVPALDEFATRLIAPVEDGPADAIPGLLPQRGQLVIAGETNIGKSLVALEIISTLVTGRPLWGELEPTLTAKRVLYVLGEHYNEVIQRLWHVTKLPMTDQVFLLGPDQLVYDKWLVAQGKENVQAVAKFQKWVDGVDLVVFDPLSAFISGIDAENDNIQMRLVLDTMSRIAHTAGASSIILAHQGKPQMDAQGKEHRRKSYAVRGASAIEDAATNIFYMGQAEGESAAAQRVAEGRILDLSMRKYKGDAPERYRLLRDPSTLTHTLLGNRPFVEVRKIDTQAKVARVQAQFPDLPHSHILRLAAAWQGVSEDTIRRDLGEKR
jgi:RecA-family ATPase